MAKYKICSQAYWVRYHALLSVQSVREFTPREQTEYDAYLPVLKRIHDKEAAESKPAHDRIMRRHRKALTSIRSLVDKVNRLNN